MVITEKIEVSDETPVSGGFADVRSGTYMGDLVAVKTARVTAQDNLQKIRKVSIDAISVPTRGTVRSQSPRSSDFIRKSFSGKRCPTRTS